MASFFYILGILDALHHLRRHRLAQLTRNSTSPANLENRSKILQRTERGDDAKWYVLEQSMAVVQMGLIFYSFFYTLDSLLFKLCEKMQLNLFMLCDLTCIIRKKHGPARIRTGDLRRVEAASSAVLTPGCQKSRIFEHSH